MPSFDPARTALVLIDLQRGILAQPTEPRPSDAVLAQARDLAARFRDAGATVVLVHVGWTNDGRDQPSTNVDRPSLKPVSELPEHWHAFADDLFQLGDLTIMKRHWGAFTGTELDLQLRRRGVTTIVLAGIATNMGVESTARSAWEHGYDVVVVEDATASRSEAMHLFSIEQILPLISRVVRAEDVVLAQA